MRFRHVYMFLGGLLSLAVWLLTDPDAGVIQNLPFGASTVAMLVILIKSILYVGMLHVSRKALMDYLDFEEFANKAKETPEGASGVTNAVGLIMIAIAIVIHAAVS